ncbi:hypothetical protein Ocin01_04491 [Orchesella cincta]|uniref:ZP domain-containing protein n=1 Tax=Orchesella cincta TaxID=48709 RepID=A0A1D2NB14_ORCCI|nr:hypothetical protein Ocin01_04491 [Orchesella cincta]
MDSVHDESNAMEFVSTSTSTSTRSNEVPIVSTSSISTPASTTTKGTTVATTSSSSSPSPSRPNEIDTEQKQQKAQPPFFTRVACNENEMVVDVLSSSSHLITEAYLQGLKNYPDPSCSPTGLGLTKGQDHHHHMQFKLSLSDLTFYRCGTNLIINKITGTRTYYNRLNVVVLEKDEDETNINNRTTTPASSSDVVAPLVTDDENYVYNTQTVLIKCQFANLTAFNHNNRIRRDVLPAGFQEAEVLKLDGVFEGSAPDPMLTMRVKQDGRVIGHELLVQPGTPLTMEVAIDDPSSREIYGILMSQMDVTDNAAQDEIIMLNGCSVDPYLFENFRTSDSDLLTAQFKAFKFPDSNYVLFRGTVNVCLESCEPTDCSNGQKGYGRRRRRDLSSSSSSSEEKSRLYEVQMTTLIRMAKSDLEEDDGMNPYILKSQPSQPNNNAMFSLLRKAREPGADQVGYVAANRALSSSQTTPSHAILLFLSFIATSSILATLALRS